MGRGSQHQAGLHWPQGDSSAQGPGPAAFVWSVQFHVNWSGKISLLRSHLGRDLEQVREGTTQQWVTFSPVQSRGSEAGAQFVGWSQNKEAGTARTKRTRWEVKAREVVGR